MTELLVRLGLMAVVISAAFLTIAAVQRRTGTRGPLGIPPGLVVVTGPSCRWCDRLLFALQVSGINYRVLDHAQAANQGIVVRSLPTALVVAKNGDVTMRRSGSAALEDIDAITARARAEEL